MKNATDCLVLLGTLTYLTKGMMKMELENHQVRLAASIRCQVVGDHR